MAEKPSSKSRGLIVGISITVVVIVSIFVARWYLRDKVEVRTAKAAYANLESVVSTNGQVEPAEDYQAVVVSPGVVQKVFVQVGDHVQRGAELVRLDDSDAHSHLAAAQASLDAAVAAYNNMQNGGTQDERQSQKVDLANALVQQKQAADILAARQALQAKGSASANEVADAQQKLADANARVTQLQTRSKERYGSGDLAVQKAQIAQAQAAVLAAKSGYSSVDFRAPFAGTIYSLPVAEFDAVKPGDALLNMADLNRLQVIAYFDEPEIGKLANGQPVTINWDAKPYATWHGHITRAPTTIILYSSTRHVGECLVAIDDAKGDLLPNTNVNITVTTSKLFNVLSVPREALRTDGLKSYVYRIIDNHLQRTPVEVGANGVNLTRVQITSGLQNGDIVATSAPNNVELTDGLEVKALPIR